MNPAQQKMLDEVKQENPTMVATFKLAYSGNSKAAAIKAQCLHCVGYSRSDVTNCTSYGCPLWPHRPFRKVAAATPVEDEQDA